MGKEVCGVEAGRARLYGRAGFPGSGLKEAGAGEGGNPDGSGSGGEEYAGDGPGGGAGGKDVVDEEQVFAGDGGGVGDGEGAADVEAALARGKAGLAVSGAEANEGGRS